MLDNYQKFTHFICFEPDGEAMKPVAILATVKVFMALSNLNFVYN
jgi:hypothetical protein